MKKLLTSILVATALLLPAFVSAQVFSQSQVILPPYGANGFIVSTTTANGGKLQATSTPFFQNFFFGTATGTKAVVTTLCLSTDCRTVWPSSGTSFGKTWEINGSGQLTPTTTVPVLISNAFTVLNPSTTQGNGTYLGTDATHGITIGYYNSNNYALWAGGVTPGATNYGFLLSNSGTSAQFNSTDNIEFNISDSSKIILDNTGAVTLTSLTNGLVKSTTGKLSNAANGTDYTLVTANTCGAGQFFNSATAAGIFGCGTPSGGGSSFGESWSIQGNGYLAPTSTRGIIVAASSTIGDGTAIGGLTVNGGATTTGRVYVGPVGLPSVSLGTSFNTYTTDLNSNVILNSFQSSGSLNSGGSIQALQFNVTDTGGNSVAQIFGINGLAIKSGSGSVGATGLIAIQGSPRLTGTANAVNQYAFNAQVRTPAGTAASTTVGFNVAAPTSGGTVLNAYGFRTAAMKVSGVVTGYGVASDGTSDLNYFLGNTGVGTTAPFAKFSIAAVSGDTNTTLFQISSSTAAFATSTLFSVSNIGTTTLGRFGACNTTNALTTDASGNITCGAISSSGGTVTAVTGTYPIISSGGTTPVISTAFSSSTLTASSPLTGSFAQVGTGGSLGIQVANTSQSGYLTNTDWNTFNNKISSTSLSVTTVGTSGAATYTPSTGVFNIPQYQAAGTYVTGLTVASANGFAGSFTAGATPALTISTSITSNVLKGNGTAIVGAVNGTDYTLLGAVTCINQVLTALTASGGSTCSTVANAMLANSTISGVALGGSLFAHTHDSTLSGTSYNGSAAVSDWGINLGNANTWTGKQTFTYSTTTGASFTYASSTLGYFGQLFVPSRGTATGSFVAFDPNGQLISTTTPTGTNFWTQLGNNIYNNNFGGNGRVGIGSTTPFALFSVASSTAATSTSQHLIDFFNGQYTSVPNSTTVTYNTGQTWTKPAGLVSITVYVIGGGGGGGGGQGDFTGKTNGAAGGNGGDSTFTYGGGVTTITGGGGTGGSGSASRTGGSGGSATNGDTNTTGTTGATGSIATNGNLGGSGGAAGASTYSGAGGGTPGGTTNQAASPGLQCGGGGSGAGNQNSGVSTSGGGGGGGGAVAIKTLTAAQLGATETIVVKGGGGGGGGGGVDSVGITAGSNSTTATGGSGGQGNTTSGTGGTGWGGSGGGGGNAAGGAGTGGTTAGGAGGTAGNVGGVGNGGNTGNGSGGAGGGGGCVVIVASIAPTETYTLFPAFVIGNVSISSSFVDGTHSTSSPALGLGTSTPSALFSLFNSGGFITELISGLVNGLTYVLQQIDQFGHLITGGPAPIANSCAGFSITGDDRTGVITLTSAGSCSITFANAWPQAPVCSAIPSSNSTWAQSVRSTTGTTFTFGTNQTSFAYTCQAHQ